MITKNELILENEKLLQGIQTRQTDLNKLSTYLSELESQLALIFAASPDIIVFLDANQKIIKISDAAFTILGYKRDEMVNQTVWNFIVEQDIEDTKRRFEEVQQKKLTYFDGNKAFINHWIAKNGDFIKLVWRFSLCDDRENHTIGVASDITQFGANNFYNFKLLQKVVDSSTDGIVIVDAQDPNLIVYVNMAYEKITGYKNSELIGKTCSMMHTDDTKNSRALKTLNTCLSQGKNCDVLLQYKRKNGELFYNRLALSSVIEHGIVVNFIGVSRDITDKIGIKYEWSPNAESGFIHLSKDL
jgi:PAS domain S-box-containing protein